MSGLIGAYISYLLHPMHAFCAYNPNSVHIFVCTVYMLYTLRIRSIYLYIILNTFYNFYAFLRLQFFTYSFVDLNEHILGCRKNLFGIVGRTILYLTHFT